MSRSRPEGHAEPGRPWFGLGRLLPRRVRERVFEPAYYDLLGAHVAQHGAHAGLGSRMRFGLQALLSALEAGAIGGITFVRTAPRRKRRAAALLVVLLLILGGAMLVWGPNYSGPYVPAP